MKWHLVMRAGSHDVYSPILSPEEPRLYASIDAPGDPFAIKNNVFSEIVDRVMLNPSNETIDLLFLALSVYTADLKIARDLSPDRWTRDLTLHVPVGNLECWMSNHTLIKEMLDFLTGDRWEVLFRQHEINNKRDVANSAVESIDSASLFSGGLDSLVGAIDLLEEGKHVALVSHYGAGITKSVQKSVLDELKAKYGSRITSYSFYVQPSKKQTGKGEPSMRSRSLLFLAMGTLVANLFSENVPLVVAENGFISLNVPLTNARIGSLSTRTTHPHFIALYQRLLTSIGLSTQIKLPYQFQTKGEMFKQVRNHELLNSLVNVTMSCSHPESGRYFGKAPGNHCGYCVPCIIRRASLASVGLDNAEYNVDILINEPPYEKNQGRDFRAFQMAVERYRTFGSRTALFEVLKSGPIPPESIKEYVEMYLRGMDEVLRFLESTLI
jgi:7-cyano-7-deazaguanine synthase in queuosine biosynthesis